MGKIGLARKLFDLADKRLRPEVMGIRKTNGDASSTNTLWGCAMSTKEREEEYILSI